MVEASERRCAILSEGAFANVTAKTTRGVIRYSSTPTVAVIDSTNARRTIGYVIAAARPGWPTSRLSRSRWAARRTLRRSKTTVGIGASAAVASLADWIDLRGNLLLANDRYGGLALAADCRWVLSPEPGLWVRRRA